MRSSSLLRLLAFGLLNAALATAGADPVGGLEAEQDGLERSQPRARSPAEDAEAIGTTSGGSKEDTKFNGQSVPPMTEIDGEKLGTQIEDGYW